MPLVLIINREKNPTWRDMAESIKFDDSFSFEIDEWRQNLKWRGCLWTEGWVKNGKRETNSKKKERWRHFQKKRPLGISCKTYSFNLQADLNWTNFSLLQNRKIYSCLPPPSPTKKKVTNVIGLINEHSCNDQKWHSKKCNGGMCGCALLESVF